MKTCFIPLFLLIICYAYSQNCNYSINLVIQGENGELQNVHTFVNNDEVVSNLSGEVKIDSLCADKYIISISENGYHTYTNEFFVSSDTILNVELNSLATVEHESKSLLKAGSKKEIESLINNTEVSTKETKLGIGLGELVSQVSGIDFISTGQSISKPIIHGLHSSRVPVFQNGIRLEDQEWGVEHDPNVDASAFSNIHVIKGASTLQHSGDAIGGLIFLDPPKLSFRKKLIGEFGTNYSTNGRGGGAYFNIKKGINRKFSFRLHASTNYYGDQETPDYVLSNTGYRSNAVSLQTLFKLKKSKLEVYYSNIGRKIGILSAAKTGNFIDLYKAIESPIPFKIEPFSYDINPPRQEINHQLGKISWVKNWKSKVGLEISFASQFNQRKEFDFRRGSDEIPTLDLSLGTQDFLVNLDINKWKNLHILTGINLQTQQNGTNIDTGTRPLIPNFDKYRGGAYFTLITNLTKKLEIETGFRVEHQRFDIRKHYQIARWEALNYDEIFPQFEVEELPGSGLIFVNPVLDFTNFSGIVSGNWKGEKSSLLLSYSLSSRAPNAAELLSDGVHQSAAAIELGDLQLEEEIAHKFSALYNIKTDFFKPGSISISPYYYAINNFIYLRPTGAEFTVRGSFPVWSYEKINAIIYGVDIDYKFDLFRNLNYASTLSYSIGNDRTNKTAIINTPPLNWKQAVRLNFLKKKTAFFELATSYFARQNRFPNYNFDVDFIENGNRVTRTVDISTPPNSYFLVDTKIGYSPKWMNKDLSFLVSVNNLFNETYRNYLNRLRFFADEPGRNINFKLIINF